MGSKVGEDEGDDKLYPNNFWKIMFSHSKTLFSAMHVTMAISINYEIEITMTIHAPALLSISENSCYQIVTFISLFCPFHCKHVPLFDHDIGSFFYSRSKYF